MRQRFISGCLQSAHLSLKRLETAEPTSLATIISQFYHFFLVFYQMMASKMKDRKVCGYFSGAHMMPVAACSPNTP